MTKIESQFTAVAAMLLLASLSTPGFAQDVVHLVNVKGAVTIEHAGNGGSTQASQAAALANGDDVKTGKKAGGDFWIDDSHVLEAQSNAEVRMDAADPLHYNFTVIKGNLTSHVASTSNEDIAIATSNATIKTDSPGDYLIAVKGTQTTITAQAGVAEVVTAHGSQRVNEGQKMTVKGSAPSVTVKVGSTVPLWQRIASAASDYVDVAATISAGFGGNDDSADAPAVMVVNNTVNNTNVNLSAPTRASAPIRPPIAPALPRKPNTARV
ncbi:MAG TPA: hypothetical protein VKU19_25500 [Bryobacteraceae bacterium]|nr:hypothetical protein [Bryobacteraceae bacterium]